MICSGNSITYGTGASVLANGWVPQLQGLLGAKYLVTKFGTPGRSTRQQLIDDRTAVDPLRSAVKAFDLVVCQEITNDAYPGDLTAAQLAANVLQWCSERRAHGFMTLVLPMGPVPEAGVFPTGTEARRVACNALLAAQAGIAFERWIDPATLPQLYAPGANTNTSYYSTDQIHPNDAGHLLLAQTIAPIVRSIAPWW